MSEKRCDPDEVAHPPVRFTLIGLATTPEFQQCLSIIEQLYKRHPSRFPEPIIRPMLEFGWIDYLTKAQRLQGGKLWYPERSFVILANNMFLGTEEDLEKYLMQWFHLSINKNYDFLAQQAIVDIYKRCLQMDRKLVFFTVVVNHNVIGTLVFMLYCDIVPKTCKKFLRKCTRKRHGYRGMRIHRIMKNSWIQCAGFHLPLGSMSNENYIIPHNKRGVLSMCNNGKHTDNKTQFFITLDNVPWMDCRYVAFGQLLQGEYVLKILEKLPTTMEYPDDTIIIGNCGEITMEDTLLEGNIPIVQKYIEERGSKISLNHSDVVDPPSVLIEDKFRNLLYCYPDDTRSHFPMNNMLSVPATPVSTSVSLLSTKLESIENEGSTDWYTITLDELFHQQFNKMEVSHVASTESQPVEVRKDVSEKSDVEKNKSEQKAEDEEDGIISEQAGEKTDEDETRVPPNSLETNDNSIGVEPDLDAAVDAETSDNTSKGDDIEDLAPDSANSD